MSPNAEGICWSCGARLAAVDYQREAECPACRKSTHVCRNCRFFAPGRPADCREPIAEPVADKQRANFCDYFEPGSDTFHPGENAEKLRSAADDLFNI
ncbi:MAG: hypothetical protein KDJ39_07855 [Gammaproteobacteria bacterium]|nr:hypothetical protein [Gammaproteobacteria bacterium]MCP5298760.1 hypothetical protein [Chromatiaceae bacterium]